MAKLSEMIEIARGAIQPYRQTGVELSAEAVRETHDALEKARDKALVLEAENELLRGCAAVGIDYPAAWDHWNCRCQIVTAATSLGSNVVRFPVIPRPIPIRTPPEGGAA
ncbi:hypothetical protein C8N35_102104 [Breoghania corrubedonensis]|uniref:Uncharacterized protein n=1 Tax=Breoghania corrubedonensis TaxID=665038 RepID=A0A2T5VCD6_9HYPH|nr:hypothetical protein [Breoghania corrubedonensis]PTW61395.1 hypothetical protein C8N35_102104 [Breoghania corrubedonensis]